MSTDEEAKANRAQTLKGKGLNGLELVFVSLDANAGTASLEVKFHHGLHLQDIVDGIANGQFDTGEVFRIGGGVRVSGKRLAVESVTKTGPETLALEVGGIGDYSTYVLRATYPPAGAALIDPLFAALSFKFRPGCFDAHCRDVPTAVATRRPPRIDYLAKDFHSFKHVLLNAMRERSPGWEPTSEADLDQVLIDLLAADGDELSDFQDRVMNEAYFERARKRVSLARYARLMDYHVHQGNQATTWLLLEVAQQTKIDRELGVWTGADWREEGAVSFLSAEERTCYPALDELQLYDWGGVVTSLDPGTTTADLALPAPLDPQKPGDAKALRDLLRQPDVPRLVVEQRLNPETGRPNGADPDARQLLELLPGKEAAEVVHDPVEGRSCVRVRWRAADALRKRFCFLTQCPNQAATPGVSVFAGNLLRVTHGRPHQCVFRPPGSSLKAPDRSAFRARSEEHYERTPWGAVCTLPDRPLAYRKTAPGGEQPVSTSLVVEVAGIANPWTERSDLIESDGADEHFVVETDEEGVSRVRFGNGANGRELPEGVTVTCSYQVGSGSAGNVGLDTLLAFDRKAYPDVERVRNPFDVTDGCDPEPREVILRRVPLAYRYRQLRAVTPSDYAERAEELEEVAHAHAAYAWTGSWRTVRVAIDPRGTHELDLGTRQRIARHLDAVRLMGEDLEVRPARYVPLDLRLMICVDHRHWPEDVVDELREAFSATSTAAGELGFFHPDLWTFGQSLHASQIVARALSIAGVERVPKVGMRRWNTGSGQSTAVVQITEGDLPMTEPDELEVDADEIVRVENDPNHLEKGRILFSVLGGRR